MIRSACLLVAAVVLLPASAGADGIAVIAVGEDPAQTGRLQHQLESALRVDDHAITGAAAIAARIGEKDSAALPEDKSDKTLRETILTQVSAAYYEDEVDRGLELLIALDKHLESVAYVPVDHRVMSQVWRTALLQRGGRTAEARTAAVQALRLRPALRVNLDIFPPDTAALVDAVRAAGRESMVTATITGLPPAALVGIDDRAERPRFRVPPGRHYVLMRAPGYRQIYAAIDVDRDQTFEFQLPVSLGDDLAKSLEDLVWTGKPTAEQQDALRKVAADLDAEYLVVAAARPAEVRTYLYRLENNVGLSGARTPRDEVEDLLAWTADTMKKADRVLVAGSSGRPERLTFNVGAVGSRWARSITSVECGTSGDCYDYLVGGGGPAIAVTFTTPQRRFDLIADGSLLLVSYDLSQVIVNDSNPPAAGGQGVQTVSGGRTLLSRLNAGARFTFGETQEIRPGVGLLIGARFETHFGDDVLLNGDSAAVFPSHLMVAPDIRLSAQFLIGARVVVRFDAATDAGIGLWAETPTNATGDNGRLRPTLDGTLGADVRLSDRWTLSVWGEARQRTVEFEGVASATIQPRPRDAVLTEEQLLGAITLRRRF